MSSIPFDALINYSGQTVPVIPEQSEPLFQRTIGW